MVARERGSGLSQALDRVVAGDPAGMAAIMPADHSELLQAAAAHNGPYVVSRDAAIAVLAALREGSISPPAAQAWASFVRRGYVADRVTGPIRPVDVEFEAAWEEGVSAAVSRLDEIGDLVEGEVAVGELLDLLQLLGDQDTQ